MPNELLETFREAYRNLAFLPLVEQKDLEKFKVEYGTKVIEELEQLVEDSPAGNGKIVFTGHRGCGKSTLLAEFSRRIGDRYFIALFSISDMIEMSDVNHINILFAIAVSLMEEAEKRQITLNNQLKMHFIKGRLDKGESQDYQQEQTLAIKYFAKAMELQKEFGLQEDLANSLNNLAGLYDSQGRYTEAEPLLEQALELWKRHLGAHHPDVAQSLNNLAALYKSQGRYTEAEPLFAQALELSERVLGLNHPNTVTIRKNLELLRAEM